MKRVLPAFASHPSQQEKRLSLSPTVPHSIHQPVQVHHEHSRHPQPCIGLRVHPNTHGERAREQCLNVKEEKKNWSRETQISPSYHRSTRYAVQYAHAIPCPRPQRTFAVPSRAATTCVVCRSIVLSTVAPWLSASFQRRWVRGSAGAPETGMTPLKTIRTPLSTRERTFARNVATSLWGTERRCRARPCCACGRDTEHVKGLKTAVDLRCGTA